MEQKTLDKMENGTKREGRENGQYWVRWEQPEMKRWRMWFVLCYGMYFGCWSCAETTRVKVSAVRMKKGNRTENGSIQTGDCELHEILCMDREVENEKKNRYEGKERKKSKLLILCWKVRAVDRLWLSPNHAMQCRGMRNNYGLLISRQCESWWV